MAVLSNLFVLTAFFYVVGPVILRFMMVVKARPNLEHLDSSNLPPTLSQYLYNNAGALRDIGFLPEGYFSLPNAAPSVDNHLIMLTRRSTGDKAMVTLITSTQAQTRYVEFSTRFASGRIVVTNNSNAFTSFKPLPDVTTTWFPQVQNLQELYALHRYIIEQEQHIDPDDPPVMYEPGTVAEYLLTKAFEAGYEKQVETGLLHHMTRDNALVYRPTWYGAYYMTWKLLFPWKLIDRYHRAKRAKSVLTSFRASRQPRVAQ